MNKTFEQWTVEYMVSRGVFDDVAATILETIKNDEIYKDMAGRWQDDISGYPEVMLSVMAMAINRLVLEWCEKNAPLAWFKPLFGG